MGKSVRAIGFIHVPKFLSFNALLNKLHYLFSICTTLRFKKHIFPYFAFVVSSFTNILTEIEYTICMLFNHFLRVLP